MQSFAQRLISEELNPRDPSDTEARAAFRVCEKLRRPLSTFAGVAGFRSLMTRALVLARANARWLAGVEVKADGSVAYSSATEAPFDTDEAAKGGSALVAELLQLLATFIGEVLTLRLVQEVWPRAANKEPNSE